MFRCIAAWGCLLGTLALASDGRSELSHGGELDHLDSAFIFINDNRPTPNIVSAWRTEGSSVVLEVRDGLPVWDVESVLRETFEHRAVERVGNEVWIHDVSLGPVLQSLSMLFLRSAPFRVADGQFTGCVILPKAVVSQSKDSTVRKEPWTITSRGVGDVVIGQRLADVVVAREGVTRHELYRLGRLNRDGFLVLRLTNMNVQVTLLTDERVMSIRPSPAIKTARSIGIGSNLKELKSAHHGITLTKVSKPYTCAASSRDLPGVRFIFTDCYKACLGESKVREVIWTVPPTGTI